LHEEFADFARDSYDVEFIRSCLGCEESGFAHAVDYLTDGGVVRGCMHPGG
jgi:hypothetical protein